MLHFDSSADWGTTLALVQRARKLMDDLITFSGRVSNPPPLPTPEERGLLQEAEKALHAMHLPMLILQKDMARAAQVF